MSMMRETRAVFFWFGGVITRSLPELIAQETFDLPIEQIDIGTRLYLRESIQNLYTGKTDGYAYCLKVLEQCQSNMVADELQDRLVRNAMTTPSVMETIDRLPSIYERWLVVDYPREWFNDIQQRLGLEALFSLNRTIFTSECGLTHLVPAIFYQITSRSEYEEGEVVLIDGDTPRAVQAVREGFSATIFVDARRLRRDFALRKLI
jgi:hypothetical protein